MFFPFVKKTESVEGVLSIHVTCIKTLRSSLLCFSFLTALSLAPTLAQAKELAAAERLSLARSFVEKMKSGFEVFSSPGVNQDQKAREGLNVLPEGELLLFEMNITEDRLTLSGNILAEYTQNRLILSMRDFLQMMDFPIKFDDSGQSASGWYINEEQLFSLSVENNEVETAQGIFSLSDYVAVRDGDIFVPVGEIEDWFGIRLHVKTDELRIGIDSEQLFPVQERLRRQEREFKRNVVPPVRYDQVAKEYEAFTPPYVDFSTNNSFRRDGTTDAQTKRASFTLRSAGDFLGGTLKSNINGDNQGGVDNARFNYSKTSLEPELLGPLKARTYELGDVVATRLPLTGGAGIEAGMRVTNRDPLNGTIFPTTQITGDARPGWDVELYREGVLVDFKTVDEQGFYSFDDVRLFLGDNSFKLVLYGLQGQVEERLLEVPVNTDQLTNRGGVYDVSITGSDSEILDLTDTSTGSFIDNPDEDEPHIVARYERAVGDKSAVGIGFRSRSEDGVRNNYLQGSFSTAYGPSLFNLDTAINDEGHGAAEGTWRRNFGEGHELRSSLLLATDDYAPESSSGDNVVVQGRVNLTGPFTSLGEKSRYSVFSNFRQSTGGSDSYSAGLTSTNRIGKTSLNQNLRFQRDRFRKESTDRFSGSTFLSRYVGGNNFRFVADYEIEPERELDTLRASVTRVISSGLDGIFEFRRDIEEKFNTATLGVNWQNEHIRVSPQVGYDTDGTLTARLSTTTAFVPDRRGGFDFVSRSVTELGGVSAFVFVDQNGNGVFDEGELPVENAKVNAVQGVQSAISDADGIALISQLRENQLTDLVLEPESLEDPFWVPAQDNVSVRPRPGYVAKLNFPVVNAGEIDGFVHAQLPDGERFRLRGVSLKLYDVNGIEQKVTKSGADGFYLFSLVKPGKYYLMVDGDTLPRAVLPLKPQLVEIGYEGTIVYGKDITLNTIGSGKDENVASMNIAILKDLEKYLADQNVPNSDLVPEGEFVLNLGAYKSRLMMALKWYLLKSRYASITEGFESLVPLSQSYASIETGKHQLRADFEGQSFDDAYDRCAALAARGFYCAIEVLPSALDRLGLLSHDGGETVPEDKI